MVGSIIGSDTGINDGNGSVGGNDNIAAAAAAVCVLINDESIIERNY